MIWVDVNDRLPVEAKLKSKPPKLGWLIFDGKEIEITHLHPSSWNVLFNEGKAMEWKQTVLFWMSLPPKPITY